MDLIGSIVLVVVMLAVWLSIKGQDDDFWDGGA